ncbi:hypothetical protein GETHOR_03620 [Geothrix oryzae]|uniref:DNA primase/polymerase bifunctional N-terminal domain-containing protein n=1 Tax=Geothrix oryzae TaxID=2927975 RepID=A0ABN6UU48_9BACT|nr:hypothetical protein [Geothrix oryzae]BDU68261.1 hypothetical protein GETHOR_03620 [Geothrix oryzae]
MTPDYPTNWYGTAIQAGIRPLRLISGTKRCPSGTWEDHILRSPEDVRVAFDQGFNVGFLLQGKGGIFPNSPGVWVNDIDSQAAYDRFGDAAFNLMVARDHPAKRHLYARLPDPSRPRASRLIRQSHDVKLTGIVVGPGSRYEDGSLYEAFQRSPVSGLWEPWDGSPVDWSALSVVDHSPYLPPPRLIPLSKLQAQALMKFIDTEWVIQDESHDANEVTPAFTTAKGELQDRIYRGEAYIRNRITLGIVSKSGNGGRATLLVIVTHLLRYLCLPPGKVLELLALPVHLQMRSWNAHCIDARTKQPYPWSREELISAIKAAQFYSPAYGVQEYQRLAKIAAANDRMIDLWTLINSIPPQPEPIPAMSAEALYKVFMELYSVEPEGCSYRRFTLAIQKARRAGLVRIGNARGGGRRKLRYYQGVTPDLLELALELRGDEQGDQDEAA